MNNKQTELQQNQAVETAVNETPEQGQLKQDAQEAETQIRAEYNTLIAEVKAEMAAEEGLDGIYQEILADIEVDKQEIIKEIQEVAMVGSEQYKKDELITTTANLSAGVVLTAVGGYLLFKTRKIVEKSKKKIVGWCLLGLGIATVICQAIQMIF